MNTPIYLESPHTNLFGESPQKESGSIRKKYYYLLKHNINDIAEHKNEVF